MHQKGTTVTDSQIAKALKPEDAKIYNSLGRSLASIGKFQEALEEFTQATKLDEEFGEAYLNKGYCLEVLGRYEEAAEILKRNTQGTQTESSTRDAGVQASSNMSVVSVQTDSLVIPVTEVATQTHILSSNAEVQTVPTQLSDSFSQTESDSEQARQVEISTSTDDLFVLGAGVSHSDILDWEVASHSSSESDESSYSESVATGSIANARIDEEEEQVLSDESQQILSKDNS
ncbi:tetratricopeptide repeat protein [Rickettsia endosymbiont of Urophora cardui]|uniref:tetratricopeptide repeat protein n=1 Tax=Rickettsia endosymbiont of Urophora cardui TaxID=3066265 RepID=UPI00313B4ED2